jgi:hypothetical protein
MKFFSISIAKKMKIYSRGMRPSRAPEKACRMSEPRITKGNPWEKGTNMICPMIIPMKKSTLSGAHTAGMTVASIRITAKSIPKRLI